MPILTRNLPLPFYIPFLSNLNLFYYPINYLYQFMLGIFLTFLNVNNDLILTYFIRHVNSQFQIIIESFQYMTLFEEKFLNSNKRTKFLSHLVEIHQVTLNRVKFISSMHSLGLYLQIGSSLIVSCFSIYLIKTSSISKIGAPLLLLIGILLQLFLYCHSGNSLKEISLKVSKAAYCTNWYTFTLSEQKIILLIMQRADNKVVISAKAFFDLSYTSFFIVSLFCLS